MPNQFHLMTHWHLVEIYGARWDGMLARPKLTSVLVGPERNQKLFLAFMQSIKKKYKWIKK